MKSAAPAQNAANLSAHLATRSGKSHFTRLGGLRLHARVYQALGSPPCARDIVVVPGLGCSSWMYRRLARVLSRWMRVWVYDPPGHGFSQGRCHSPGRIEQLTDTLALWLGANNLQGAALLGHSLGGEVIIDLAARYPQLAGPLIACAPTGIPENPKVSAQLIRLLLDLPRERPQLLPWGLASYLRVGAPCIYRLARDQDTHQTGPLLGQVRSPVLVIDGTRDPVIRSWTLDIMAQRIPGARGVEIAGGPHALTDAFPVEVAMHTLDFLEDLQESS